MKLGTETTKVLEALRSASENEATDGWRDVYLDNAKPTGMKPTTFRSYLAKLSEHGYYQPIDGYAWGKVKMEEA